MTPAVQELIEELNKNGGQTTISNAMNFKIGTIGSNLDFRTRLYALERHGYIVLKGETIKIHPDYEVKPEPTLAERLANYLMKALEQSKRLSIDGITAHLKELCNEFKMAGARRKQMLQNAISDLRRLGVELLEELDDAGLTCIRLIKAA